MHNINVNKPLPPERLEYDEQYVLRPLNISDLEQIEKAVDLSAKDLRIYMEWSHHPLTKEKQAERIVEQYARYFLGIEYELGMFDKRSGELLYYGGLFPINRINPRAFEVGFWVPSNHSGKGLATLATKLTIAFLFEYIKADRIEITANIENKASLKVIEKCGFKQEGELRNFYPEGTLEMFQNGYTKERTVRAFSLIPEDRKDLNWYSSLLSAIEIYPVLRDPYLLG